MYIQSVFNQRCFKLKCVLVLKHGLCTGMTLVLAAITLDNYCIPNRRVLTWWRKTSEIWHIVIAKRFLFEGQVCKLECSPIYIGILRKLTLSCFSWKSKIVYIWTPRNNNFIITFIIYTLYEYTYDFGNSLGILFLGYHIPLTITCDTNTTTTSFWL